MNYPKVRDRFIYSPRANHVTTTLQYVDACRRHSRHQIDYLSCSTESELDLSAYDAVWSAPLEADRVRVRN